MKIEIFKTGKQVASNGQTINFSEEDLKLIAEKYNNQSDHQAPLVLGHPKDSAPAYGWVKNLEAVGDTLYATLESVSKEFIGWCKDNLYKKRSASFYPDLLLRHVGFLGAVPPAVKGLEDFNFSETLDFSEFEGEFEDEIDFEDKKLFDKLTEFLSNFFRNSEIDFKDTPNNDGDTQNTETAIDTTDEKASEEKVTELEKELADLKAQIEALTKTNLEYAEKELVDSRNHFREEVKSKLQNKMSETAILSFCDLLGDRQDNSILDFCESLPLMLDFSETTVNEAIEKPIDFSDRQSIHKATLDFSEKNKISYSEALSQIMKNKQLIN